MSDATAMPDMTGIILSVMRATAEEQRNRRCNYCGRFQGSTRRDIFSDYSFNPELSLIENHLINITK